MGIKEIVEPISKKDGKYYVQDAEYTVEILAHIEALSRYLKGGSNNMHLNDSKQYNATLKI